MLDLDDGVRARVDQVRDALGDAVVPFSVATPHVTVWVHGFGDDAAPHAWEGRSWRVGIGGANAFLSCPYLEVRAPEIDTIRRGFVGAEERWAHYLPHLTVGRFAADLPTSEVVARLRPLRRLPRLTCAGTLRHGVVDAWAEGGDVLTLPGGSPPVSATMSGPDAEETSCGS